MSAKAILLTKAAAAEEISSSIRHLDNLIKAGLIHPIRRDRWVRIPRSEIEALPGRLAAK